MKRMILIFSHTFTDVQKKDAMENLHIDEFVYLPEKLQNIWSHLDPKAERLKPQLIPLLNYIKENVKKSDLLLVQGDFGATFIVVNFAKKLGLETCYSTTSRVYQEKVLENGTVVNIHEFKHERFRKYE